MSLKQTTNYTKRRKQAGHKRHERFYRSCLFVYLCVQQKDNNTMRYKCVEVGPGSYELLDKGSRIGFLEGKATAEEVVRRLNITEDPEVTFELFQKLTDLTEETVDSIVTQCEEICQAHATSFITFSTPIELYRDHQDRYEAAEEQLLSIDDEGRMTIRQMGVKIVVDIYDWVDEVGKQSMFVTKTLQEIDEALLDATEWEFGIVEV